jgi:hypothetical protein
MLNLPYISKFHSVAMFVIFKTKMLHAKFPSIVYELPMQNCTYETPRTDLVIATREPKYTFHALTVILYKIKLQMSCIFLICYHTKLQEPIVSGVSVTSGIKSSALTTLNFYSM